jgi:alanyl-tRNA synthetase
VGANSMDDRYLSQIVNGRSKRCVCMYACYYGEAGGRHMDSGSMREGDFSIIATL